MTLDLAQFPQTFFEESFEALDSMETALLKLDIGAPDKELINTIFRVAHSIKGGAGSSGLENLAHFTHALESLLDRRRRVGPMRLVEVDRIRPQPAQAVFDSSLDVAR